MTEAEFILEILNMIGLFLTPILVLIVGLVVSKKIEKNKLDVLKEKEWQVKWAELFFNQATEFNEHVSIEVV